MFELHEVEIAGYDVEGQVKRRLVHVAEGQGVVVAGRVIERAAVQKAELGLKAVQRGE